MAPVLEPLVANAGYGGRFVKWCRVESDIVSNKPIRMVWKTIPCCLRLDKVVPSCIEVWLNLVPLLVLTCG